MPIRRAAVATVAVAAVLSLISPSAHAVHFYRGPGGGCTPTDGTITDDPENETGPITATVLMYHNTFHDRAQSYKPETRVKVGEAVLFTWNSAHCHSVKADDGSFYSGFHYPTTEPTSPRGVPGFFDYPALEQSPTLRYVHTFKKPGTYRYTCEHHGSIGMFGDVIVEA